MIEIQQLERLDLEQVINLLLEESKQPFEIYVPKSTQQYFSERVAISEDYACLAYSGHLLREVSDEFDFDPVSPEVHESVLFTVKAKDFALLAEALLEISYGYVNDHPEDEEFSFSEDAFGYLEEVEQYAIYPIACPYFVEISKEFSQDEDDKLNNQASLKSSH